MGDKQAADLAKKVILECLAEGMTVEQACATAGTLRLLFSPGLQLAYHPLAGDSPLPTKCGAKQRNALTGFGSRAAVAAVRGVNLHSS